MADLWGVDVPLDLPPGLPELPIVGIYHNESQIAIVWGVDLPLDLPPHLPELSE